MAGEGEKAPEWQQKIIDADTHCNEPDATKTAIAFIAAHKESGMPTARLNKLITAITSILERRSCDIINIQEACEKALTDLGAIVSQNALPETEDVHIAMEQYIQWKQSKLPSFDNDDFLARPDLIVTALAKKPYTILSKYEEWGRYRSKMIEIKSLTENPRFLDALNRILASEYPYLFGEAVKAPWYTDGGPSLDKISTMLDIIKYRPPERQKDFIAMMNGETELFEQYFIGTEIGNQISVCFKDSPLIANRRDAVSKALNNSELKWGSKKWGLYDLIRDDLLSRSAIQEQFSEIPLQELDTLLSLLPDIEAQCPNGNIKTVIKAIDPENKIDPTYKEKFFHGLMILWACKNDKYAQASANFYGKIEKHFYEKVDVSNEKRDIELKKKNESYEVIINSFPGKSREFLDKKNAELSRFLDKFIDNTGNIAVTGREFKNTLLQIFKDSPLEWSLRNEKDGKAALEIVSGGLHARTRMIREQLQGIDSSFDPEKLSRLQKDDPLGYAKLKGIFISSKNHELKLQTLQKYSLAPKQFASPEQETLFVEQAWALLIAEAKSQVIESIQTDKTKGDLFGALWRGEIKTEDFNTQIEKLDQEIQREGVTKKTVGAEPEKGSKNTGGILDVSQMQDGQTEQFYLGGGRETAVWGLPVSVTKMDAFISVKIGDQKEAILTENNYPAYMESLEFLQDTWLGYLARNLSPIAIRDMFEATSVAGKTTVNNQDGSFGPDEQRLFLRNIARLLEIEENMDTIDLENMKHHVRKSLNEKSFTERTIHLQKDWFVNQIINPRSFSIELWSV